ncbi:MAG: alkaline phosphatase family protein [Bdellovibrionales bacterium]|nr:alkaline phosphatase family protein [Ramlibacter sp.]
MTSSRHPSHPTGPSIISNPLRSLRRLLSAAVCITVAACAAAPGLMAQAPSASAKPRLVVFLVVDGLPQRQVTAYRDQLAPDGLARFLDRGAWFANAHYGHSFTVTGAGHATMLTGAYPHRTGIIGNDWRDPQTGEPEYCAGDASATYIGHKTGRLDGTSPKNLKVETVGDVLRGIDARSKVIAISGKDRGAILPGGKTGTAYMYMEDGEFASTTFYMKEHPAWVNAYNGRRLADSYFKKMWTPVLPAAAYAGDLPDDQPWYGPAGGKLPMMMGGANDDAPKAGYYRSLLKGPFADVMSLEFARAAIAGEALGQDDIPDILAVSLSGHDYVNHAYSAESRMSHDHLLQLDRMLQDFFQDLDRTVGKDNYIAMLTADHGFTPAPEYSASRGLDAGRFDSAAALVRVNAALEKTFEQPRLVRGYSGSGLLLDRKRVADARLDMAVVTEAARAALLTEPAIGAAYTRAEFMSGSRAGAPFFGQMEKSWHKDVSGEVQFVFKPNWIAGSAPATHGSPYEADTQVPILMYGPRWIKPGRFDARVEVVDIAPTLAAMLGVPAPSASEGRVLPSGR